MYVDVHSHLTHEDFSNDLPEVVARAEAAGLGAIVVNGLEPKSNRRILELATTYSIIKPALGIYPIDAINGLVDSLPHPIDRFDTDQEIAFIEEQILAGKVFAIGECGLDGYWVGEETFAEQERVFEALIEKAMRHNLPLIIHTRKREERAMEILAHHKAPLVDFHCYGGKSKPAIAGAEKYGWYFSIPANARRSDSFRKLLKDLPQDRILTETDCPYLGPEKGVRNEPANVVGTIEVLAELRGMSVNDAEQLVWTNYQTLFAKSL